MADPQAQDATNFQTIASYDPATLEWIGEVSQTSDEDVAKAVDRAREAQQRWQSVPVRERGRILLRARDYLVDHIGRIAELVSRESGKPLVEAIGSDLFTIVYLIDYFAKHAESLLTDEPINIRLFRLLGRRSRINRTPRGVVGIISPWNFPFTIPAGEVCMALMAGNAVVLKPSRTTCLVGEAIGEVYNAAGLPEHLLQVVHGSGSALARQPVDFIAFTGSVDVGKKVMAQAAQNLTPVMLELGGKDAAIICRDANLEVAASTVVWGAFTNAGQGCASVERLYVDRTVADDFIARVVDKVGRLRQGHGLDPSVDIGPLCTQEQLDLVKSHVDNARRQGARILTGGEPNPEAGPGYFYKPTVMADVGQDWQCMQEETFGPTLPIVTFTDEAEAVEMANDSTFGLTASVWTRDIRRGEHLAHQIVAGTVAINDAAVYTHGLAEVPWGGYKDTGVGRTHGKYGLLDFTEMRHIHVNRVHGVKNPWLFSYSPQGYQGFKSSALLLRSGWGAKARGVRGAVPAIIQALRSRL